MKMRATLAACLTLLFSTGVAAEMPAEALDQVSAENLRAHYAKLAGDEMEGRFAGTDAYARAAEYVAEQFALLGLEPAGEEGWFQQVPLISYRVDTETTTVYTHRDGVDTSLTYREDYGMGGDKVRESNELREEVVYVGYGVHAPDLGYSDYADVDVKDKIVAIFDGAPSSFPHNERAYYASGRTKAEEAVRRGAVGIIGLRSRLAEKQYPWERYKKEMGTRPGMAWINLSGEASDYFPELGGSMVLSREAATALFDGSPLSFEDALDAIEDNKIKSLPLGLEVSMSRETSHEEITSPNVVGLIRGTDPELRDEFVVFSAHLDGLGYGVTVEGDSIYNGAYDNAMGVALMLETAKALAKAPPRRSVLFVALTAEERGLLGSDYFAHYPTVPSAAMIANVNLDMPLFLYPLADLIAFGAEHSSLEEPVRAAAEAEGFTLTPDPLPEETLFVRSDQYSFVRKGIPAIYLISGFNSTDDDVDGEALFRQHLVNHYHQPSDDLELPVDWDSAVRFARTKARIGYVIGNDDNRPVWNEGDFFGEKFGR
jgi:hypothetical protein